MTDLLTRLQDASAGSRGLDYEIHESLGWRDDDECGWFHERTETRTESTDWPHYTTSIDAALPLENIVAMEKTSTGFVACHAEEDGDGTFTPYSASAKTEALARRIAALQAQQSTKAEAAPFNSGGHPCPPTW